MFHFKPKGPIYLTRSEIIYKKDVFSPSLRSKIWQEIAEFPGANIENLQGKDLRRAAVHKH